VSHFRGVDRALLDLAPGLNVLYGPNDLGKTTLAMALRAVLLLPADSSAQREFLPWHSREPPRVVLSLESRGTLWRISKTFGTGSGAHAQGVLRAAVLVGVEAAGLRFATARARRSRAPARAPRRVGAPCGMSRCRTPFQRRA